PQSLNSTVKFKQIQAGSQHTSAISENDELYCFGRAHNFRLGQIDSTSKSSPIKVDTIQDAYQLHSGDSHNCVLNKSGQVQCFGSNNYGQLALPLSNSSTSTPNLLDLKNIVKITGGQYHNCALQANHYAKCWGYQTNNQLGNGNTTSYQVYPSSFAPEIGKITDISSGNSFTCAINFNKEVYCLGVGGSGQLGDGLKLDSFNPVKVSNIQDAIAIDSGHQHTCILHQDRSVSCFGNNNYGQTGDQNFNISLEANKVNFGADVVEVIVGKNHTCAILKDGALSCFGHNQYGKLGIGTTIDSLQPKRVFQNQNSKNLAPFANAGTNQSSHKGLVFLNAQYSFDINLDPLNYQWSILSQPLSSQISLINSSSIVSSFLATIPGDYTFLLELSDATNISTDTVKVTITEDDYNRNILQISASNHTCVLLQSQEVECFGLGTSGQLGSGSFRNSAGPIKVKGINNALQISTGENHSCVLLDTGKVKCFGNNAYGQLGDQTTISSHNAVEMTGVTDAISISTGSRFSCILTQQGTVKCLGYNGNHELGNNSNTSSNILTQVHLKDTALEIYSNQFHSCALLTDNSLSCWGYNGNGQLGDLTSIASLIPVTATTFTDITQVSLGQNHTCIIRQNQDAYCFGDNSKGQAGSGYIGFIRGAITKVLMDKVKHISAGLNFTCASNTQNEVACFGQNQFGQLANNDKFPRFYPSYLNGISDVVLVEAGNYHACILQTSNRLSCFGYAQNGRLGSSTYGDQLQAKVSIEFPNNSIIQPRAVLRVASTTGISTLLLDARGSFNPTTIPLIYQFSVNSSPEGANSIIQSANTSMAQYNLDQLGLFEISLTVTSNGQSHTITRIIHVITNQQLLDFNIVKAKSKLIGNLSPIAILEGQVQSKHIYLSANKSYDPEGDFLLYQFQVKKNGFLDDFSYLSESMIYLQAEQNAVYEINLSVSDGDKSSQIVKIARFGKETHSIQQIRSDQHSCFITDNQDLY
ncbi:hypothetical protein MJH12_07120, partial [bacterium]|nr:hypothetical protein [bacterium]